MHRRRNKFKSNPLQFNVSDVTVADMLWTLAMYTGHLVFLMVYTFPMPKRTYRKFDVVVPIRPILADILADFQAIDLMDNHPSQQSFQSLSLIACLSSCQHPMTHCCCQLPFLSPDTTARCSYSNSVKGGQLAYVYNSLRILIINLTAVEPRGGSR